jgi:Phosphodiesterase/alkaline phosphatase D
MKPFSSTRKMFLCIICSIVTSFAFSQTVIIPYGATWKYLDNGSNQGTAWRASGFNDASWSSGAAELGYGDGPVTTVSYGPDPNNKYITTYFRKTVNIPNPGSYSDFTLNIRRDDGVVVYINGTERYANNMPAGRNYNTLASAAASDDGGTPQTTTLLSSYFVAGNNTIAVEIHQNSVTSTDMTFDLELIANTAPATIINFGDVWKYLDNNTRPTGWNNVGFNDAAWASGPSELGYADGPATTVSYGPNSNNKYITTYFRKTFNVTNLDDYTGFTMNIVRDDGVIVYLNGVEVIRNNMPSGTPTHNTLASSAIGGTDETTPVSFSLSKCLFVEGSNTLAVEVHQNDPTSTDLSFNLQLLGNLGGGDPSLSRGPYLQSGSQTSITIRWRTNVACSGRVELGTTLGVYDIVSPDESCPTTEHIITVNGLSPDTKYYYRILASDGTVFQGDADNFFRTNPTDDTKRKIRVIAFGDCGRGNSTYQDQNLASYRNYLTTNGIDAPDAWILLGDNAYNSGTDVEYTNNFFGIYGNNILKNHKLYPAPGNHDYGNNSSNKASRSMPYHSIFSVPQLGEAGGIASNRQNYYSYDVGNIHFLSLDSYGIEGDGTSMLTAGNSELKAWIQQDLENNTKKWTVAYWHHPPYTKTSHNSDSESDLIAIRQNFITYLESLGVDLIINGHSHGYERGYMLKNFTGSWTSFNPGTHAVSTSSGYYDGTPNSCPYVYNSTPLNHGTVYVVAGSAGASGGVQTNFDSYAFPFSVNDGGVLYFEVEENRQPPGCKNAETRRKHF